MRGRIFLGNRFFAPNFKDEDKDKEKGREKEKDKGKGKDKETENKKVAFVKGLPFFSWLQDQLWKSSLQMWTLSTNLLKCTGPSHGPVPWTFVEKLFFKKGLKGDLIFLGQGDKQDFFQKKQSRVFLQKHFLGRKKWSARSSCHNSGPSKHCMGSE